MALANANRSGQREEAPVEDVTRILGAARRGDDSAARRLLPLVYDELRAVAGEMFVGQPPDHTLQPTALVHEAYARLIRAEDADWTDRTHRRRRHGDAQNPHRPCPSAEGREARGRLGAGDS